MYKIVGPPETFEHIVTFKNIQPSELLLLVYHLSVAPVLTGIPLKFCNHDPHRPVDVCR